jgi:hypothetical protein
MSLIHHRPPAAMQQVLLAGLPDFANSSDPAAGDLYKAEQGHEVYVLSLNDLLRGAGLNAAKDAGWRFISAAAPGGVGAVAHVSNGPDGTPLMRGISYGPEIAAALRAAREVESLPEVAAQHFELWVLRIPGVLVEAYWLKASSGKKDLIVPYLAGTTKLQLMKTYSVTDFLKIVRALAQEFSAFDRTATTRDSPRKKQSSAAKKKAPKKRDRNT